MILRIKGNPADLERYAAGSGGEIMRRISEAGRSAGAVRHRFAGGDNEVLVVDEWPDEQSFQAFFASQPEIADVMRDGGAQGPPENTGRPVARCPPCGGSCSTDPRSEPRGPVSEHVALQ